MSDTQRNLFNTRGMTTTAQMRALKRPAMEAPYKKPVHFEPREPCEWKGSHPEFNLFDEERSFKLSLKVCPQCHAYPFMRRFKHEGRMLFQVYCAICERETPALPSSKDACHNWQLVMALLQ